MQWRGRRQSTNIRDVRSGGGMFGGGGGGMFGGLGRGGGFGGGLGGGFGQPRMRRAGGGLGIGMILVIVVLAWLFGFNPMAILGGM